MNTEQLKTDNDRINETLHKHFVSYGVMKADETLDDELEPAAWAAMQSALTDFASQESKRAVDEFKDKLLARFRELKSEAPTLRDTIYLDGVLAVISSMT